MSSNIKGKPLKIISTFNFLNMQMHTQVEIERKYLVDIIGQIPNGDVSDIWQTYLL